MKIVDLIKEEFDFRNIKIKKLAGYENRNCVISIANTKYIFKIC